MSVNNTSYETAAVLNPTALSVADAARLLTAGSGQPITDGMIRSDLDAGAPANPNGTINLVWYGAWLVREMASRGA